MLANTCPLDVTGHPACNVPAGLVDGLPTGMMIVGKCFDDVTVLRAAGAFEQAVGGFPPLSHRKPALSDRCTGRTRDARGRGLMACTLGAAGVQVAGAALPGAAR